jgi:hypothetical protein
MSIRGHLVELRLKRSADGVFLEAPGRFVAGCRVGLGGVLEKVGRRYFALDLGDDGIHLLRYGWGRTSSTRCCRDYAVALTLHKCCLLSCQHRFAAWLRVSVSGGSLR